MPGAACQTRVTELAEYGAAKYGWRILVFVRAVGHPPHHLTPALPLATSPCSVRRALLTRRRRRRPESAAKFLNLYPLEPNFDEPASAEARHMTTPMIGSAMSIIG